LYVIFTCLYSLIFKRILDEVITKNEVIEPNIPKEMIRQDPYSLPDGFVWDTLDLENEVVVRIQIIICLIFWLG